MELHFRGEAPTEEIKQLFAQLGINILTGTPGSHVLTIDKAESGYPVSSNMCIYFLESENDAKVMCCDLEIFHAEKTPNHPTWRVNRENINRAIRINQDLIKDSPHEIKKNHEDDILKSRILLFSTLLVAGTIGLSIAGASWFVFCEFYCVMGLLLKAVLDIECAILSPQPVL